MATAAVRLVLLGSPRIAFAHAADAALERKDAALLALLAIDGTAPRARVAALLWPDSDSERARNNLRQRLFRLRRAAGRDVVPPAAILQLADDVTHDLADLPQRLRDDPAAAAGDLLGDLDYGDCPELADWVQFAREHWRAQRRNALAELSAACEGERQLGLALIYAERAVADDPLHEHAHRRVMRLHYLRSDRAAALASFERCREWLQRELATHPSAETLDLAALIEAGGTPAAAQRERIPVGVLRPPRLIGRDAEWEVLTQAAANGQVIVVRGEPGIGKTRLIDDFCAASPGAVGLGARPGDRQVPYALLARFARAVAARGAMPADSWALAELARILPEWGDPPTAPLQVIRLRQACAQLLEAAVAAGVAIVAIDDLQFGDAASLELLPALALHEGGAPSWLLGLRTGESSVRVEQWSGEADAPALVELRLAPLTAEAIYQLLQSLAIAELDVDLWAPVLANHTGGNPMFILETLRALLSGHAAASLSADHSLPLPPMVGEVIERRLSQLSTSALRLARVAALAGQDFSVELAAHVLRTHALDLAEAWRELEAAQVIREQAFAHDLIYEATLRSVPKAIAQLLNREIADYLQTNDAPAARVAQHWFSAGEWARAGAAFATAAREARRSCQRALEVEHWHGAAECFDRAGDGDRAFDARHCSVEPLIVVRGVEMASTVIDRLLNDARSIPQRVAALTARATARLMAADHAAGVAAARQAHQLARSLPDDAVADDAPIDRFGLEFEAARLLAVGLAQSEHADEAGEILEPYREPIERSGSIEQRTRFWSDYAYVLNSARRLRQTADALGRAIELARALADFGELATLTSNLAQVKGNLGNADEALEWMLRARSLREQLGETSGPEGAAIDMYIALYSAMLGRYSDALYRLEAALTCFGRDAQTVWIAVASNHLAGLWLDLGQVARAGRALDYAPPAIDSVRARRALIAGRIERRLGRNGAGQVREALSLLGTTGDRYVRMQAQLDEAMLLPAGESAQRCVAVRELAEDLEYLGIAVKARLLQARCLLADGDSEAASKLLSEPTPYFARVTVADLYPAEAHWIAYQCFAAGHADNARRELQRGFDWIHQVALPQVPAPFRDSFLQRNPVNRSLLTTASRLLRTAADGQ